MKKKKKPFYPLPADGAPYRPSFSLGLWITALEAMLIVSLCSSPSPLPWAL